MSQYLSAIIYSIFINSSRNTYLKTVNDEKHTTYSNMRALLSWKQSSFHTNNVVGGVQTNYRMQ